jgi:hypothetical protein
MKTYTFQITVDEGSDEWWEQITANGRTGVDDVQMLIFDALVDENFNIDLKDVKLVNYKDES